MAISPNSDLSSLADGTRFLARRPWVSLGIGALGAGLTALELMLLIRTGLPEDLQTHSALLFATLLPLELYFIPRFLMEADAKAGDNPFNAAQDWKVRFEERWMRTVAAKFLLALSMSIAALFLLFPALLVLMAFGWAPWRVLLRGEGVRQAFRGSLDMLPRCWRRMLAASLPLAILYLASALLLGVVAEVAVPKASLHQRLVHPLLVLINVLGNLLNLWLTASLLALFRRLDPPGPPQA